MSVHNEHNLKYGEGPFQKKVLGSKTEGGAGPVGKEKGSEEGKGRVVGGGGGVQTVEKRPGGKSRCDLGMIISHKKKKREIREKKGAQGEIAWGEKTFELTEPVGEYQKRRNQEREKKRECLLGTRKGVYWAKRRLKELKEGLLDYWSPAKKRKG